MKYKNFIENLLDVNISIDWTFPYENNIDQFLELKINSQIYMKDLLSNIAFSFVEKDVKKDLYDYLIKINTLENNQMIAEIADYFNRHYSDMNNAFSSSNQIIEKLIEGMIDWIDILKVDISNKLIDRIHLQIPTQNKKFWFYFIEQLYLLKEYETAYYLINKIKELNYIKEKDELFEELTLYKVMCLNEMKFNTSTKRQEEVISLIEKLENYSDISLSVQLEYYTFRKDKSSFNQLIHENIDLIKEYSIDDLINMFELSIICGATESYMIIDRFLKSRDVPYYKDSVDYDIYILLQAMYYTEISKVLKGIKKIHTEYPYAYDFEHIEWFYRNNKKIKAKIKIILASDLEL